jgi:hypothetical protein
MPDFHFKKTNNIGPHRSVLVRILFLRFFISVSCENSIGPQNGPKNGPKNGPEGFWEVHEYECFN